ncbi:cytochrome b-245 chaperone 1-like isoform X3 [Ostrea edulis]|uniref:cytochrome b-245 chaperone 1-like isoform X3 n=1 Tax=Ostrea edulis TaxID=37623 RepID=UPI0024AE899C|nr:cytochrome b-245 chaperone 1-like isoform X3 [Ostrea edulis]
MGGVKVKEETPDQLKLAKEPSLQSFSIVVAFMACGYGAAAYSEDSSLWMCVYVVSGFFVGLACIEDWEYCEFDKSTNELRQTRYTVYDKLLQLFTTKNDHIEPLARDNFNQTWHKTSFVVTSLSDIVDVVVEEQHVRYFGNTYQTVMVYDTGICIGVTESFVYGNKIFCTMWILKPNLTLHWTFYIYNLHKIK